MNRMMCTDWNMCWNLPAGMKVRMGMGTAIGVLLCIGLGTYTAGDSDGRSCYCSHTAEVV